MSRASITPLFSTWHAGLDRVTTCNESETQMNSYRENVAYALQRAREYVALGDTYMARVMTACAETNMKRLQLAETQMNLVRARRETVLVSIPLHA